MWFVVFAWLGILCGKIGADNFPSLITTNATLAIVIDREFLNEEYDKIKNSIETYLIEARREILKHGGLHIKYFSWTNIDVRRDITAVLSIASCADTWKLFQAAEDQFLLHMAISESDCPRLPPEQAVTIPLIKRGQEMAQLLLDLRTIGAYKWKSIVLIYDETISRDMVNRLVTSLTRENLARRSTTKAAAISIMKLNLTSNMKENSFIIKSNLSSISTKAVGSNFLVMVSFDIVETIMEIAKNLGLVNTKTQWLYMMADTNYKTRGFSRFKRLLKEGDNAAFLYNTTVNHPNCVTGMECHSKEILKAFTTGLDAAIQEEYEIAAQVSDEEWEAIRPNKSERRNFLLNKVKTYLIKYGNCDNCTTWNVRTGETWGREYQSNLTEGSVAQLLPVGSWRPIDGLSMNDELFLHIAHGFRGLTLPLISYHNPPWQILKVNESGQITEYSGLVFDIIRELANNLNFTYTIELSKNKLVQFNQSSNSTSLTDMTDLVTNRIPDDIKEMVRNKSIALAACAFTITENSKRFVNFTSPISIQPYSFLVARPRELSRALLFMSPFTGDTWLCLTGAIISMGPILYYIHRYSPMYEYKGISKRGGLSSVQNCIWYMYGALLQQGGMHLPQADSARLIVGSWWLVVLVVATTYCGNLVAFLTFPKIDIPITTVDELLNHRATVSWSFQNGSFLDEQLQVKKMSQKVNYSRSN